MKQRRKSVSMLLNWKSSVLGVWVGVGVYVCVYVCVFVCVCVCVCVCEYGFSCGYGCVPIPEHPVSNGINPCRHANSKLRDELEARDLGGACARIMPSLLKNSRERETHCSGLPSVYHHQLQTACSRNFSTRKKSPVCPRRSRKANTGLRT